MDPKVAQHRFPFVHKRGAILVPFSVLLLVSLVVMVTPTVQAQTYTVLHNFTGSNGDAALPTGNLIRDAAGNLYGTTSVGGASGAGTVYKIDAMGNVTILHAFNVTDGSGPQGSPVVDAAGNLYGITGAGGPGFKGIVFKLDPSGNLTDLYDVPASTRAGLIMDAAGNLYGTTFLGGNFSSGTVFKLAPSGNVTVLHMFGETPDDGVLPQARLVMDSAGNLYGTTGNGGANTFGTIFKIDTAGNYNVLHSFTGADGAYPSAGMMLDAAGNLYGTTFDGGANNLGVVFKLDTGGNLTVLHSFTGGHDGAKPISDLIRDAAGNFYGTTAQGGDAGFGTVFRVDASGNVTTLHTFNNTDGSNAAGGLVMDTAGTLYGTTFQGGTAGQGVVFKLTVPAQLNNFTAQVVAIKNLHLTAVGGKFNSTTIHPITQNVSLSIDGTNKFTVTFAPGAFRRVFGVYAASATLGTEKLTMLLRPLGNGNWTYSAIILGFVPGSISVTVNLTIGTQSGSATVNAHIF